MTKTWTSRWEEYGWDEVNRMTGHSKNTGGIDPTVTLYQFREDGMRARKEIPGLVEKVYYDGQMPVETFEDFSTGNDKLTRNFVGARGIEMMETTTGGNTTQAYPLYDTHGNMVATLSKNTAGTSWSLGNERSYDVWGSVRSGAAMGGPKGRYVANLGHVADDESGLIYMRARYYEPESGRFVSEDPACDGTNYYQYAENAPTCLQDLTGLFSGNYVADIFSALKDAMEMADRAAVNPELKTKMIRQIKEIMDKVRKIGRTAEILGEAQIATANAEAEAAAFSGSSAGIVMEGAIAQASGGGATLSIKAIAAIVMRQLELVIEMIG